MYHACRDSLQVEELFQVVRSYVDLFSAPTAGGAGGSSSYQQQRAAITSGPDGRLGQSSAPSSSTSYMLLDYDYLMGLVRSQSLLSIVSHGSTSVVTHDSTAFSLSNLRYVLSVDASRRA